MNNLNTEEDEVSGGGGGGGGGGWWWWAFSLSLGAAGGAAGVAALVWKMYQSKKQQVEELEGAIRIYQGYVEQDQQEKLSEVENLLVERQHAFCSNFKSHRYRHGLEEKILRKASALESVIPDMSDTVRRIFTEDRHCGSTLSYVHTRDKRNNGCLMWEEMKNWRRMVKNSGQS